MSAESDDLLTKCDQFLSESPRRLLTTPQPLFAVIAALRVLIAAQFGGTGSAGGDEGGQTPAPLPPMPSWDAGSLSQIQAAVAGVAAPNKRLAAWQQWSDILGGNWHVALEQDGTIRFDGQYTSAFTPGTTLSFPGAPDTVNTNTASDIDAGTWLFRMHKHGDRNTRLLATAGPAGSGAQVIIGQDLDGSLTIDPSALVFTINAAIDNVPGGGGGAPVTLSLTDPRVKRWVRGDKAWNSSIANTIHDFRVQIDSQYTASETASTPGQNQNGHVVQRTADRVTWNGITLLRRWETEPAAGTIFTGSSQEAGGGCFEMRTIPQVYWTGDGASSGNHRSTISAFGAEVAYGEDVWIGTSFEWAGDILAATGLGWLDVLNLHYADGSPGNQQPFDLYYNTAADKLDCAVTYAADGVPNRGGQTEVGSVGQTPTLAGGHRYYLATRVTVSNKANTGRLQMWIRDGRTGTKTKFVDYSGSIGWPGSMGTFNPKVTLYAGYGSYNGNLSCITDGLLITTVASVSGLPTINEDVIMDTVAYA